MADEHALTPRDAIEPELHSAPEEAECAPSAEAYGEDGRATAITESEAKESEAAATDGTTCAVDLISDRVSRRCGLPVHLAPEGVDEEPRCILHSRDPAKLSGGRFWKAFQDEFDRVLRQAEDGCALFNGFVFPEMFFYDRTFEADCWFDGALFMGRVSFRKVTFKGPVSFSSVRFEQEADFEEVTFCDSVTFWRSVFDDRVTFKKVRFERSAILGGVEYSGQVWLEETTFSSEAFFSPASFTREVRFTKPTFLGWSSFAGAAFGNVAFFIGATFAKGVDFSMCRFDQESSFDEARIQGTASWASARFLDQASFRDIKFESQEPGEPSAVFALAQFAKPGATVFDNVDLSRALFQNCDVSAFTFTSSVRWAERKSGRGLAVFEETIPLESEYSGGIRREDGHRDLGAIAQIYQQLKKNYDSRLDYWTADEFHYGEMEMKRLAAPHSGRLVGLRQWWHRNLSLVALYRTASDYGNSYGKPALWIGAVLVLFAALLPLPGVGLNHVVGSSGAAKSATETYWSVWSTTDKWVPNIRRELEIEGKAALAAVDTVSFQRNAEYTPAYPWGRVLAILTTVLTSTLFGLFLLAVRRQFKR